MNLTVERLVEQTSAYGHRRPAWLATATVACLCLVVGLSRLPFLTAPVSPDEGGFLVVAAQWGPGSSLYGSYWVDRPPLLIAVFSVADVLGGPLALRLIGTLAVVVAIGAAGVIGWVGSGRRRMGAVASACVAAALLATPLFGTRIVDGELLSSPLVMVGLAALLVPRGRTTGIWAAGPRVLAGALAASAFLIKQDMVDVFVVAAVLGAHTLWRRGPGTACRELLPVAVGAVVATTAVLALAAAHGTPLTGLWSAVVTFRLAAAGLLGFSSPRLSGLVHAYVVTGAPGVSLVAGLVCLSSWRSVRAAAPLGAAGLVLTLWELAAAVGGGSYWSHYLIGSVPGVTLLVAAALRAPGRSARWMLTASLTYAVLASTVGWSTHPTPAATPSDDQVAASYVRDHARPGDSVVVAFGHADIVEDSGLGSPYPYLWALPAFVKDPRLTVLDRLLGSSTAPRWFVAGCDLSQWGPRGTLLQHTIDRRYSVVLRTLRWVVLRRDHA